MSKIQKEQQKAFLPLSDWDIFPWTQDMYQKHENEFKVILGEYRAMRIKHNDDAKMARWRWIESKGGMRMVEDIYGILQPHVFVDKYPHFSNMFERFDDWLSFQEKRNMAHEVRGQMIRSIFTGMKKPSMSIPQGVRDGSERDVANEEQKIDDMTKDALNNF